MDAIKRQRKVTRMSFTKVHTAFVAIVENGMSTREERIVAFQLLETKMTELNEAHVAFNNALFQSDLDDEAISKELETDDVYKTNFLTAKLKMTDLLGATEQQNRGPIGTERKMLKLPRIELPKFNGSVKEWLPFWSQFKKIHDDQAIGRGDKFQYLLQATVTGSRASELVNSFPPTEENYEKAVTSLKNRFGRDDIVVEYYVRELLGLVLQNAVKGNKKPSLANLYDKVESYIRALETLGVATDKCAAMLYPLVESSLPEEVLRAWQRNGQREAANANDEGETKDRLARVLRFLQLEVENEERIDMAMQGFQISTEWEGGRRAKNRPELIKEPSREPASASALLTSKEERQTVCIFCKGRHESQECEIARKMSFNERKDCVQKENACFICINRGHVSKRCRVRVKCAWCGRRHVLLFCPNLIAKENRAPDKPDGNVKKLENSLAAICETPEVYLQTLRVKLYSDSRERTVRAILDTASQRSYIRADIATEIGYVPRGEIEVTHSLFGGVRLKTKKHNVFLIRMKSLDESYACNFSVISEDTICETIPCISGDVWVDRLREKKITLSDIGSQQNSIQVLIGADVAGKLFTGEKYDMGNGLVAMRTLLGWTVIGRLNRRSGENHDTATMFTTMFVQQADVSELWRLDILGINDPIEKISDTGRNENTRDFIRKTMVEENGRYMVRLPWKQDHSVLSENRDIAKHRLTTTIDKLNRQNLFFAYDEVFKNWLAENIIERVSEEQMGNACHYLPHRPVVKLNSTTKIRPVFDASANKKGYPSLNQCLEKGPNLIELVPSSLNRFRERKIGVISDIKGAFLQIAVQREDRDFLRFLWQMDGRTVVLRHCRVVFGLSPSPFLLSEILTIHLEKALKLAKNEKECSWSEKSVQKLKESFYVDNCVTSVDSMEELHLFIREATRVMATGSFDLRGWEYSGNCSENTTAGVLGISWNKERDTISINPTVVDLEAPKIVTKRSILSGAHKVFDPIGFTCPVSLQPRILLTRLWLEGKNWDEKIDDKRSDEFLRWTNELPLLRQIELPRGIGEGKLSIHSFGDASGAAYAAIVFARVELENFVGVHLLNARTRIAPKNATIPRLELMAATIAVRLTNSILGSLTRRVESVTYWSDSTTVLAWLKRDIQWGAFVYNRVKEIRTSSDVGRWRYVPGDSNPADLPSRGCSASQLIESQWWLGPRWLRKDEIYWPSVEENINESIVKSEIKKSALVNMVNTQDSSFKASNLFSTYTELVRFMAWMRRFLRNRKILLEKRESGKGNVSDVQEVPRTPYLTKEKRKKLYLSVNEVKEAEIRLLKHLQRIMFTNLDKSKLSSFKVLLNNEGLYVVKTKILNRDDDSMFLSPIILDKHDIVTLLVRETHDKCGHAGSQIVMNTLREQFWIISLRQIVRSVVSRCVICKRYKTKHMQCEPPPLPAMRVRDSRIFEATGIDFAGPVFIKGGGKGWICIFTCAVYRAVHFELASSLSVDGFIECLRRFIARRGRPRYIFTDNGTNFTGTAKALEGLDWEKILKQTSVQQIEWRFNPPSAPWWGGWWERLIGVLKTILRKILGKASLSYESLTTSLCDAEAVINSRPLTYVSDDPENLKPLTPAMFIKEIEECGVPDLDMFCNRKLNKKRQYRQKILNDLRARFRLEYLSQLLLGKGKKETREIKVGDIVLIGDDIHKRVDWPLARIVEAITGRDGKARVYVLKTKNGLLKRPIQRIYPLEVAQENTELVEELNNKVDNKNSVDNPSNKNVRIVKTRSGRLSKKPNRFMY